MTDEQFVQAINDCLAERGLDPGGFWTVVAGITDAADWYRRHRVDGCLR